jgi:hypothetical protein
MAAPTVVGNHVMAVCTQRRVEGYALDDMGGKRFTAMVAGLPLARPTASPDGKRLMWPTDSGFVYAIDGEGEPGLVFRFPADGLVSSKIAAGSGERFFMGTEKGQVYALDASKSGSLLWRQSLGEPIYASPVVVGDRILVKTVYGHLYCLNASDGSLAWPNPVNQVQKVFGGTNDQILVSTLTAHLESIDAATGTVNAEFFATNVVDAIENPYTDRLYLMTSTGSIQCLRPIDNELPQLMMGSYDPTAKPQQPASATEPMTEEPAAPPASGDPFGAGGADPFGGGADPFGGGADPFGGSGDGGMQEDPFGGF